MTDTFDSGANASQSADPLDVDNSALDITNDLDFDSGSESSELETETDGGEVAIPVESDGGIGDGAGPIPIEGSDPVSNGTPDTVLGTSEGEGLFGDIDFGANDVVLAGGGNDDVDFVSAVAETAPFGEGVAIGGSGNDIINAFTENYIFGGAGNDAFSAEGFASRISGGEGDDVFFAVSGGENILLGGAGHDIFNIASGGNIITGGEGSDTFIFADDDLGETTTIVDFTIGEDVLVFAPSAGEVTAEGESIFVDGVEVATLLRVDAATAIVAEGGKDTVIEPEPEPIPEPEPEPDPQPDPVPDPEPEPVLGGSGEISGLKFNDLNGNGVRDSELIQGENPDVIFTIDVSGSTDDAQFIGTFNVGDLNNDGRENDVIDAEIAGFIALNQQLIDDGLGDTANVGIVAFSSFGNQLDLDPATDGVQLTTTPNADNNNNGILDVNEVLQSLQSGGGTNFANALEASEQSFIELGTQTGNGNLIFLSDGQDSRNLDDELERLNSLDINISAFGVGDGASIENLITIDPDAEVFTSTDGLLASFGGVDANGDSEESQSALEPTIPGVTVFLDLNENGVLDEDEPSQVTDANGDYIFDNLQPGTFTVREIVPDGFTQTAPSSGEFTVTLGEGEIVGDLNFGNVADTSEPELEPDPQPDPELEPEPDPELDPAPEPEPEPVLEGSGEISGLKFNDLNGNGVRDTELVQGENPDVVFVIDVSGSTNDIFQGTPINEDGSSSDIFEVELAAFIGLNQQLIDQGLGDNVDVGIVAFGSNGLQTISIGIEIYLQSITS
ncbi:MAG: SdrD B-like domain-containing protein, partial [Cyanobacteria bacterium J06642_3]